MGKPELDKDDQGEPIQGALCPRVAQKVDLSTTTARCSADFTYKVISFHSDVALYFKLGDSTVEATSSDHHWPAGAIHFVTIREHTRIAAILASGTGTLYISEMG